MLTKIGTIAKRTITTPVTSTSYVAQPYYIAYPTPDSFSLPPLAPSLESKQSPILYLWLWPWLCPIVFLISLSCPGFCPSTACALEPLEKGSFFKIAGMRSGGWEWLACGMVELGPRGGAGIMSSGLPGLREARRWTSSLNSARVTLRELQPFRLSSRCASRGYGYVSCCREGRKARNWDRTWWTRQY